MKEQKELKVFEIRYNGDVDTICHYTNIAALQLHCHYTDCLLIEFDVTDEIVEIPKDEWNNKKFRCNDDYDDEGDEMTISEYMETHNKPELICSTCF